MSPTHQTDWRGLRGMVTSAQATAAQANSAALTAEQKAAQAETAAKAAENAMKAAALTWERTVTITYSTVVSLSLAPREMEFSIVEAKAGDRVQIFEDSPPTLNGTVLVGGIFIQVHAKVHTNGKVSIRHVIPAVGLGQTLTIPLRLLGYRPAT